MNEQPVPGAEFQSPAEEALHDRLEVVRDEPPQGGAELAQAVDRTLRWQAIMIVPVTAALVIAGGFVDGLQTMLKARRR